MYIGIVTANKLNVRTHPAYDAPVVDTLEKNDLVEVSKFRSSWLEIRHLVYTAFIHGEYIDPLPDNHKLYGKTYEGDDHGPAAERF